jgi:hypothetical protein
LIISEILNTHLVSIAKIFVGNVGVESLKSRYGEEEVKRLPGVRWLVMQHLQNVDNVLADIQRARATIYGEKSDWCWIGIKIDGFVCAE